MIDHGGGSGVCVSASSTSNNHGDVGSSSSNSSSHRGVGGDDKHVVATAASSSSSDSQAQLPPPHHQHQGSTTHTFDRDAALVALRRLGADMDERFVEQQQLLRIAYEHLCIQIEQLRCRVPYVTMTAPAGAAAVGSLAPAGVNLADCLTPQKNNNNNNNHDSNDNAFAMMTVNALLHDTQQPHSDTKRSGQRDGARLGDVTGGVTTTLMGTPAAAVGSQRYRHHDSQPRDDKHNDDKDDDNNNGKGNDTLAPAGTLGSIGDSGTAAVGPLSATRSHPFLSVFDDMSTTTTTMTTMGDSEEGAVGTQSTNVRKDDVASSLAADLATAAVAAVVGDDEDDEDEQQRQRRQQQQRRNDATTTAMTTTAAAAAAAAATPPRVHGSDAYAYAVAAATLSPQTHATTDAAAPPLHPRSASGSGYAAAATHDGGSWHALSSTSPARHGNTAAATAAATDTFTASPQALSKLSIDVLSCFGQQQGNNNNMLAGYATEGNSSNYPHHAMGGSSSGGGVHLSFEKLYTQLTSPTGAGVQGDSGRLTDALYNDARFASLPVPGSNSNSSVNSSNTNNNVTTATVASASAATAAAAAAMLGASPSSLPPPSHAQMTQQQQQQQQQHQVSPAARHARAHDIIPIDSLRTLHDQHLTTTIKAVYEHGRPVVVPTPGGAPVDVAALGIDVRSSCQVLVEFKRERVLQYDSVAFVAPGSYVMVGGDRGEDLGLVIYTWCEVSHKPRNHQHNNNSSSGNGSGNGAADAVAYSKDSSSNNDGNDKVAALGDASSSGNAHVDAVATAAAVSSALPTDYAHQRSAVVGIGLTGSRLRRSIGVGNGTVLRLASDADVRQLHTTQAELERRAIDVCGQRVLEHALPMVIVDAEYQYDKNKLTFFYEAQQRLDFRELVRDLFKTFRARIWMEPLEV